MHVVQQFNMVIGWKTYPKKATLYHYHAEKAIFKYQHFAKKKGKKSYGLEVMAWQQTEEDSKLLPNFNFNNKTVTLS